MTREPFDKDTINSIKRTGKLLVVHEAHKIAGWGAEVAAAIMEEAFDYLMQIYYLKSGGENENND
ncbi:MAG: hypothetical protein MJA31_10820 [Clostridia bacterium]|nr:hypothetical protein [Clostridia bacterium]